MVYNWLSRENYCYQFNVLVALSELFLYQFSANEANKILHYKLINEIVECIIHMSIFSSISKIASTGILFRFV